MSLQAATSSGKDRRTRQPFQHWFVLATAGLLVVVAMACDGGESGGSPGSTSTGSQTPDSGVPATITPSQGGITPIFPEESPTPAQSPTPPAARTVEGMPGASIEEQGVTITLNKIEDPWQPPAGVAAPEEGMRFVSFDITVRNDSDISLGLFVMHFILTDVSGLSYDPDLSIGAAPALLYEVLEKGDETQGFVGFELDEGAKIDLLTYRPRVPGAGEAGFNFP